MRKTPDLGLRTAKLRTVPMRDRVPQLGSLKSSMLKRVAVTHQWMLGCAS
jgi:hypothetical protein